MPFSIRRLHRSFNNIVITLALLLVLPVAAQAGLCTPLLDVEKQSAYRYVLALVESMDYAKRVIEQNDKEEGSNPEIDFHKVFYLFKLAKADLNCAKSIVAPYVSSTNKAIKPSAELAEASYSLLAELQEQKILHLKSVLDAGSGKFRYGTFLERMAEHSTKVDMAWKLLFQAAIAATFSVVGQDRETKLMSRLALTDRQRSEILQKLHSTFGDEIKKGAQVGQSSVVGAGGVLYQVIGDSRRKTNGVNIFE